VSVKLLHELVRFVFCIVNKFECDVFHRQIERSEAPNRFIPHLDVNLSAIVVDDYSLADYLIGSHSASERKFSKKLGVGTLHL